MCDTNDGGRTDEGRPKKKINNHLGWQAFLSNHTLE